MLALALLACSSYFYACRHALVSSWHARPQVEALVQELRGEPDMLRQCQREPDAALGLLRELRMEESATNGHGAAAGPEPAPLPESSSVLSRCCSRLVHECLRVALDMGTELLVPSSLSVGAPVHNITIRARALPAWWRGCSELCNKM
jgi:hypothetical protein